MEWSKEFPTEESYYWLYIHCDVILVYGHFRQYKGEMALRIGNAQGDGFILYDDWMKDGKTEWMIQQIVEPKPPTI